MLPRSFKAVKCKTALKLAVARIKLLKNKREVQVRQMRRDLAQLLESGQEQTARIRVEHVIREEKTMSAYDLIELYCELIVARLPIIESQKGCPIDLKEAVSSVLFSSPRCADIPELMDVKKQFVAKYGKEFVNSALEVRPDCGVNRMVVEKLSAKAPDVETKIKTLTAIAQEHNVKWDPKALEGELHKPNSDLLNGPNTFANASKMSMESSDAKISSAPNQMNEPTMKLFQNDSKHASMNTFSHSNPSTQSTPVSSRSQKETKGRDDRFGEEATPHARADNSSLGQQSWNMEFKDAASAAQAAAESAERASMAARAAAELASRGNVSRPPSAGPRESSKHDIRDDRPNKLKGPTMEATLNNAQNLLSDDEMLKRFQELKRGVQTLPRDDDTQVGSRREAENTNDVMLGSVNRSPSHSSECSVDDDELETELHKTDKWLYGHAQESFSKAEPVEQDEHKKNSGDGLDQWNVHGSYDYSSPHQFTRSATEDDSNVHYNIQKNESRRGKDYKTEIEGEPVESSQKQPAYGDYSYAVFDDYGSDTDNISLSGKYREGNSFDPFKPTQEGESSTPSPKSDPFSRMQHSSRDLYEDSSSQPHFVTETSSIEHFKTINDPVSLSQSDKNSPATFDDSDGLSSESEGEVVKPVHKEAIEHDSSLHNNRSSTRETISEGSDHGLHNYSFRGKEYGDASRLSTVSPSSYEENHELEAWERSNSIDLLDNPTSSNLISSRRDSNKYPTDNKSLHSQSSQAYEKAEADDMNQQQSPPSDTSDTEDSSYGIGTASGQGLGLGRLTGGFRNKGFRHPPYVKNPLAKSSHPPQQTSNDVTRAPTVSHSSKLTEGSKFPDHVGYDKDVQSYSPASRISPSYMGSGFDKVEELEPTDTFGRRGYRSAASLSSDETTGATPTRREGTIVTHQDKISEDHLELPPPGSYYKTLGSDYKLSSEYAESNINPEVDEYFPRTVASRRSKGKASVTPKQNRSSISPPDSKQTLSSSQGLTVEPVSQRQQQREAYNERSLRKPVASFESDEDGAEDLDSRNMVGSKPSIAVKLSRRTRDTASDAKRENNLRFISRSDVPADFQKGSMIGQARSPEEENSNSVTEKSSVVATISQSPVYRDSSKSSNQNLTQSTNNENPATSSSDGGESSLKKASHVHPKLPDYDSLAAHFHSLRSNIR